MTTPDQSEFNQSIIENCTKQTVMISKMVDIITDINNEVHRLDFALTELQVQVAAIHIDAKEELHEQVD